MKLRKVLLLGLVTALALFATTALAQYPPPGGNITKLTTPKLNPTKGTATSVFGRGIGGNGFVLARQPVNVCFRAAGKLLFCSNRDPLPRPSGDALPQHPGHDPVVILSSSATDDEGNFGFTIDPGDYEGLLEVEVTVGKPVSEGGTGVFSAQMNLGIGLPEAPAQPANVVPFSVAPLPPNTGAIALPGGGLPAWALPLMIVTALGGTTVMVRARRRI